MSFRNTKTPLKTCHSSQVAGTHATEPQKWREGVLPRRRIEGAFLQALPQEFQPPHNDMVRHILLHPATLQARMWP